MVAYRPFPGKTSGASDYIVRSFRPELRNDEGYVDLQVCCFCATKYKCARTCAQGAHCLLCPQGGYPIGSGGIESANKFICHVRFKDEEHGVTP